MIRKYHNHKLQTNSNDSSLSPASPWRYPMLAKPAIRRWIPLPHGKRYCIYIGLDQVSSKAFINKPAHIKICRCKNLSKYVYARLHSLQSCIITAIIYWGDIIIGLIATLNAFIFTLYCRKKFIFMILKCTCRSNAIHVTICKFHWFSRLLHSMTF